MWCSCSESSSSKSERWCVPLLSVRDSALLALAIASLIPAFKRNASSKFVLYNLPESSKCNLFAESAREFRDSKADSRPAESFE